MSYIEPPTEEQIHDILQAVGADDVSIKNDINYLIEWLEKIPYLPSVKDEVFLRYILLSCKNSVEKTKRFLDYYYTRRTVGTDMFSCRDPCGEEFKKSTSFLSAFPLPKLTPDAYRVIVNSFRDIPSTDLPKLSSVLSMLQMETEVLMKCDINKGIILILDAEHFGPSQAALFITEVKKVFDLMTKTNKSRCKETYIINMSPVGQQFYNLTKNILSGKMLGRIHLWNKKPEELSEILPVNVLPLDFGGQERPISELRDAWYEYVKQHRGWFKSEESVRADLSKRPKDDPISQEFSTFGLTGSFRQINLD